MKKILFALFLLSMVACNMNYEKTPSGLTYKIFKGKDTVKARPGEFAKFNMKYILVDRDSVFSSTYGKIPGYGPIDTGRSVKYSFMEILPLMSEGDSAEVSISIDTLKNMGVIPEYNAMFVKGQIIKCKVQLLKLFNNEKDMIADYQKSIDQEKDAEDKSIEDYLAKKNLKGVKTKNGAYVVIENAGDQSLKADSGKVATLMYKGYLQDNGKVFDTNMDTSKGHTDPIQVQVGSRGSIQGFSECLPYFGKGGKGKFLIPSMLGYGGTPQGADIPAYSNLIFDIEVMNVTDAPPTPRGNPQSDSTNH
ncbi:MAG TPA: FKBP-type peptidyl-prolyl cis-trans isomerase [Parafilimonas sp.]